MHNKNTTIDKVALELFNKHFGELNKTQQQTCNQEMVNNPKWLAPFWKQPGYKSETQKFLENKMENYLDNYFGGNPVKEINKICDDLISFAYNTGTVVNCGACENKGCNVCEETNH